ncbi:MBOAT family O-acyltransferase [Brevundimonas lenta]|uniref:Probable alginate O-acetylase AlgI n=1 Tax=Brevundimonas lenta TaxID=424796 RepID=A0A7W6JFF4_9CAUL|nr:MBOAT family O-acyltransferase [Brevundimonas lenta]MBB4084127.1 D-alanyl-lipoteichoic acid acyltransferase DltB (MBOAT superfamily) [Brevundimonas lenta]
MQFTSMAFLGFVLLAALLAQPLRGAWRTGFLIALNIAFAASFIASPLAAVPLLAFVLAGYAALVLVERRKAGHAVALSVLVLVAVFIWLKRYPFVAAVPELPFPYALVGLSYILFRLLHLVLEVGDGALKRPSFPRYMAYLFFFPAFLSGPIHRYEPFDRDLDAPAGMDSNAAFATLLRFLVGFAKVAVVGECLLMVQELFAGRLQGALDGGASFPMLAGLYAFGAGLYLLFLYANFSGYTDMAIAVGRLFGVVLPENFNRPFMATNFQDFWSRWHITLSEWFKIYFFNPLLKLLMGRFDSAAAVPYLGVFALFITFVVLGFWHGSSWEYLLTGALLGVGISINKLYQVELTKRMGKKPYQALTKRPAYIWASRGLTLAWVSLALTPFWIPVPGIGALLAHAGVGGFVLALVLMSAAFAIPILIIVRSMRLAKLDQVSGGAIHGRGARIAILAGLIVLLAFAVPLLNSSSDFVYQAF